MDEPGLELREGDWTLLGADAARVRTAVFIDEQHISVELEWDDDDARSLHLVAYDRGVPVATGRLLPDGRIGRMAVLADRRGSGVGGRVLRRLVAIAAARGHALVELSAQTHACRFYARHGFEAFGPPYDDAGIEHRAMRRRLR